MAKKLGLAWATTTYQVIFAFGLPLVTLVRRSITSHATLQCTHTESTRERTKAMLRAPQDGN